MANKLKLEIIYLGTTYDLTSLADGWVLTGFDGLGLANVRRYSVESLQQDGESDYGYKLDPRVLQLALAKDGNTAEGYYNLYDYFAEMFGPSSQPVVLRITKPNGVVRQGDCFLVGGLSWPTDKKAGWLQREGVTLKMPDPTFYNPEGQSRIFALGYSSGGFIVPASVPMGVGTSVIDGVHVIQYPGTARAWPIITIEGPATAPTLTNETTGDKLEFKATVALGAGDKRIIDCSFKKKTVIDQSGNDKIADLTDDSDIVSFCLASKFQVALGSNTISFVCTNASAATKVTMTWVERYLNA